MQRRRSRMSRSFVIAVAATVSPIAAGAAPSTSASVSPIVVLDVGGSAATVRVSASAVSVRLDGATTSVPGAWDVPTLGRAGARPWREGGASNAKVLVLVERGATEFGLPAATKTRFALIDATSIPATTRTIALNGQFGYDTVSPDGKTLFVLESKRRTGGAYVVRSVDLRTGLLAPGIVFDKARGNPLEMYGQSLARTVASMPATRRDVWVLTLYDSQGAAPFVHALNASSGYALCIDLPPHGRTFASVAKHWSLGRQHGQVVVGNSLLGARWTIRPDDHVPAFTLSPVE